MENFWNDIRTYFEAGFQEINAVQGLLIALVAAYFLASFGGVFVVALSATVVHIVVDALLPVLANNAQFQLPPLMEGDYWRYVVTLYAGYLIAITVFYVIKRVLMRSQVAHA